MSTAYRKWKRSSKSRKTTDENIRVSDVTLSDFADSGLPTGKGRLKKAHCSLTRSVKQISNVKAVKEAWDENLEDEEEDEESGVTFDPSVVVKQKEKELNKKNSSLSNCSNSKRENSQNGLIYPVDIWFQLSEYISPEDVKTFSLICKGSYYVVNTPKFWITLYKRYYRKINMPKSLLPNCLEIHHGLKASVIQALFYMYWPFSNLVQTSMYLNDFEALNKLVGKRCILMWIERKSCNDDCDKWIYKFKFKRNEYNFQQSQTTFRNSRLRIKSDVNANPEEGCQILNIPSRDFVALPCINGSKLKNVTGVWKSVNFVFSTSPVSYSTSDDVTLVLRPCFKPSLFDWWHPMYRGYGGEYCFK